MIPPKKIHPRTLTGTGEANAAGVSAKLWEEFEDHAAYALYNPFVVALAAGTLKMESLLNYLGQDVYYLEKYVEACTMAEDCTDTDDDKEAFKSLIDETKDYTNESQKWISAKECPNMAAVDYTRFLLATAAGKVEGGREGSIGWDPVDKTKIPAYTICSITPCSRLYRFLGEKFVKALEYDRADHPDKPKTPTESVHPYKDWIDKIFPAGELPLRTEQMLDILAKNDTKNPLRRLYYHALNHEIQFFAAVPLYQRTLVPLLKQSVLSNCRYTIHWLCSETEAGQTHVEPSQEDSKVVGSGDPQDLKKQIRRKINSSNVDMHIVSVSRDVILSDYLPAESAMEKTGLQHISICIGDSIEHEEDVMKEKADIRILSEDVMKEKADISILILREPPQSDVVFVKFVPLFDGVLKQERAYAEGYSWIKQKNTIYTVSSRSEIFAFLYGTYN